MMKKLHTYRLSYTEQLADGLRRTVGESMLFGFSGAVLFALEGTCPAWAGFVGAFTGIWLYFFIRPLFIRESRPKTVSMLRLDLSQDRSGYEYAQGCLDVLAVYPPEDWAAAFVDLKMEFFRLYSKGRVCSNTHGVDFFQNIVDAVDGKLKWTEPGEYGDNFRKLVADLKEQHALRNTTITGVVQADRQPARG